MILLLTNLILILAVIKESTGNLGRDIILNDTFTYYSEVS